MEVLLCPSKQRRNILSVIYGRPTSHLVRVCVCVGGVLFKIYFKKIRSLIVLYSTNIATQNIKRIQRGKKLPFIMSHFLVISHLSEEACWFIYKQNTHVSSLISLWLDCFHHRCFQSSCLLIEAGASSSTRLKCGCLSVCFCRQRSLSHSTHTLVTSRSACNISGGT